MKHLKLMLMVWMALILVGLGAATSIPVSVESVDVDGTYLTPSATNRLQIERGQEFDVEVKLLATGDGEDIQIEAFISGYEYSDFEPISDATHVFDVEEGVIYRKTLTLKLPDNVDEDNYKLRVVVSDRYSEEILNNYNLKIDVPRHSLQVEDVWFTPANTVSAGEYLIASARLKNYGDKDEEGIKVVVSIPELGISATDYIDELEAGDSISSEELYLKLPRCNVKPGLYDVEVVATYDDGHETTSKYVDQIQVVSGGACEPVQPEEEASKLVVTVETLSQNVVAGGHGVVFPLTVTNTGDSAKTLVLSLPELEWGALKASPSTVLVVGGGETQTAYLYLTAIKGATEGEHQFTVALKSVNDETLKEVTFKAGVEKGAGVWGSELARGLEIALVVLILILVVIGLILGLRKLRGGNIEEGEEEVSGETYY